MVNKNTHEEYKTELFMPVMKKAEGKYIAILSDDSVDRDGEKLSKECLIRLGKDDGYLAALCNHRNDVFMQVAEWTNRGIMEIDGHTALMAEPKFYKSNPNAKIIQGMLDEGAKIGVSIGALVKDYDDSGDMRIYKDLELMEASFVAVPSNRHARALAVAKSYNKKFFYNKQEENKMDLTQKDVDAAVEKKAKELEAEFKKQLEAKDSELAKLQEELVKVKKEAEDAKEESEKAVKAAEEKVKEAEKALDKVKQEALEKQKYANGNGKDEGLDEETIEKELKKGKLPILRV